MPLYEYVCEECDHQFQQQRKVTDRQLARCPKCKGSSRKIIGAVGIIFKGSGWHCTDYRKADDKTPATDDKTPATESKTPATEGKTPAAAAPKSD